MRKCGECTACCITLQVDVLYKPAGVACHSLNGSGCGIYEDRPVSPCQTFSCAWLQGHMDDEDRPDKAGVIVWQTISDGEITTIASQLEDREISDSAKDWLDTLPLPVRLERIGEPPTAFGD